MGPVTFYNLVFVVTTRLSHIGYEVANMNEIEQMFSRSNKVLLIFGQTVDGKRQQFEIELFDYSETTSQLFFRIFASRLAVEHNINYCNSY